MILEHEPLIFGEAAMCAALGMTEGEFAMARCCGKVARTWHYRDGLEPMWSRQQLHDELIKRAPVAAGHDAVLFFIATGVARAEEVEKGRA